MSNKNADSASMKGSGAGKGSKEKKSGSICSLANLIKLALVVAGISVVWKVATTAPRTKVVQTSSGPIRGEELTFDGTSYKAFKGIPYAAPPVKDLKFKDPQPPQKWTEVRDTRAYGNTCPQPRRTGNLFKMDTMTLLRLLTRNAPNIIRIILRLSGTNEDCLTLNVFSQSLGEHGLKPVLVWIHGGGFFAGDGTDGLYGPEYLLQQDIVVVTMNYRVGPLGFLSTGTPDATGNWGMKDQVAALKWVQENIANFGGDPKQVTIYGESAGGASVHLHLFSPLSKGLFQKVISASGSATSDWAVSSHQDRMSRNLARVMGASKDEIEDPAKRVKYLKSVDSKEMTDHMFDVFDPEDITNPFFHPLPFVPVLEPPGTIGAFLTEHPRNLIQQGKFIKVPMMMGLNDLEGGLMFMGLGRNVTPEGIREVEKNLCQALPQPLKDGVITKSACSKITDQIRNVYFDGKSFDSSLLNFVYFFGDLIMVNDVHFAQRQHVKHVTQNTPLYNYYFTFDGQWNLLKEMFVKGVALPGALHGDDITYVFRPRFLIDLPHLDQSSREVITKDRMISFITNFVKYGNPTPSVSNLIPVKWEPATKTEFNTMFIGDNLRLEKDFLKTRMNYWNETYIKYTGLPLFN